MILSAFATRVTVLVLLAVGGGTAADAETAKDPGRLTFELVSNATGGCLAADFSAIYTYGCGVPNQRWALDFQASGYTFQLRNTATGYCLANNDFNTVHMTGCASGEPGLAWRAQSSGTGGSFLRNAHINRYLVTDFSNTVYLADFVANQHWTLR